MVKAKVRAASRLNVLAGAPAIASQVKTARVSGMDQSAIRRIRLRQRCGSYLRWRSDDVTTISFYIDAGPYRRSAFDRSIDCEVEMSPPVTGLRNRTVLKRASLCLESSETFKPAMSRIDIDN